MNFPYKIIDLTYQLDESVPCWDNSCGFNHAIITDYQDCTTDVKFRINEVNMYAGIGTHIDAPAHCIQNQTTIEQLKLDDLCSPLVVINVSHKADQFYQINIDDINKFEDQYGQIPNGSFVILYTGWCKYWSERDKYHNNYCFPSVGIDAAKLLLERNIRGLGVDTLSPDRPDSNFCVHQAILGAGKYIVENITSCEGVPDVGAFIGVFPLKIKAGTEAPVRLVAFIPESK